jgi:protein TonB
MPPADERSALDAVGGEATPAPAPAAPVMFGGVVAPRSRGPGLRAATQLASVTAHLGLVLALVHLGTRAGEPPPEPIAVRLVQPAARASPPPPPPAPSPRPQARTPTARRPQALIAPTVIPDTPPAPGPVEEAPAEAAATGPAEVGGVAGGREGGVVGGVLGAEEAPVAPLLPARPADVASVRAGIARTLVYPPEARRREWGGRVVVAFTLFADGTIADLVVRQSSGHPVLDAAALEAIRRAAPFPPPGVGVLVVVPVAFSLR